MKFWQRARAPVQTAKGKKINRRADKLQRVAARGLADADAVTALGCALGKQVAKIVMRHPNLSIDEMLHLVCQGVHEQAHMAAGSSRKTDDPNEIDKGTVQ